MNHAVRFIAAYVAAMIALALLTSVERAHLSVDACNMPILAGTLFGRVASDVASAFFTVVIIWAAPFALASLAATRIPGWAAPIVIGVPPLIQLLWNAKTIYPGTFWLTHGPIAQCVQIWFIWDVAAVAISASLYWILAFRAARAPFAA